MKNMRASAAKKQERNKQRRSYARSAILVTLASIICWGLVSIASWQTDRDISRRSQEQLELFSRIDEQVRQSEQRQTMLARKIESSAKASSHAGDAAQGYQNRTDTTNCGVPDPSSLTVLVNKNHCFSPLTWGPTDLAPVAGYYMRQEAAEAMQSMLQSAAAEGLAIQITSAYRSYHDQVETYDSWVASSGSSTEADAYSARPGYSEHQTGLAADFKVNSCALDCFETTAQYRWLAEHAAQYGFIRRYPKGLSSITGYAPESWHWRYIGTKIAEDMKSKGIETLEIYFRLDKGDFL